jgi:hypothetical protein
MQIIPTSYHNIAKRIQIPDLPAHLHPPSPEGISMPAPPSSMPTPTATRAATPQVSATPVTLGTPAASSPPSRSQSPSSVKTDGPRVRVMGMQEDGRVDESPVGDQPLTVGKPHVNPLE